MRSYSISPGGESITCLRCGLTSYNRDDVDNHYCASCHGFHDDVDLLVFWVIYDHPSDYPDCWVMRRHIDVMVRGQKPRTMVEQTCRTAPTIDELRAFIPRSAVCIGRYDADDPKIAEVWLS